MGRKRPSRTPGSGTEEIQQIQRQTEEMYIYSKDRELILLKPIRNQRLLWGSSRAVVEGLELGILETAKEEGREEGRVMTAKAALKKELAVELVAEITGLPLEEILKLQYDI